MTKKNNLEEKYQKKSMVEFLEQFLKKSANNFLNKSSKEFIIESLVEFLHKYLQVSLQMKDNFQEFF